MAVLTGSLKNNYSLKQALNGKRCQEFCGGDAVLKQQLLKLGDFHRVQLSTPLLWVSFLN